MNLQALIWSTIQPRWGIHRCGYTGGQHVMMKPHCQRFWIDFQSLPVNAVTKFIFDTLTTYAYLIWWKIFQLDHLYSIYTANKLWSDEQTVEKFFAFLLQMQLCCYSNTIWQGLFSNAEGCNHPGFIIENLDYLISVCELVTLHVFTIW